MHWCPVPPALHPEVLLRVVKPATFPSAASDQETTVMSLQVPLKVSSGQRGLLWAYGDAFTDGPWHLESGKRRSLLLQ